MKTIDRIRCLLVKSVSSCAFYCLVWKGRIHLGRGCRIRRSFISLRGTASLSLGPGTILDGIDIRAINTQIVIGAGCFFRNSAIEAIDSGIDFGAKNNLDKLNIRSSTADIAIGDDTKLEGYRVEIEGKLFIGPRSVFLGTGESPLRVQANGRVYIGEEARVSDTEFLVLENGQMRIGSFFGIGPGSEMRVSESFTAGDYLLMSYNTTVFDTNTHSTDHFERREEIKASRGLPATTSVVKTCRISIGNDVWIGKGATILKGTSIGDRCIVGTGAIVSGRDVRSDSLVVASSPVIIERREDNKEGRQ